MVETAEIEPRSEGSIQGVESTQNSAKVVQFSVLQKLSGAFTPAESPTALGSPRNPGSFGARQPGEPRPDTAPLRSPGLSAVEIRAQPARRADQIFRLK
jgi:hypothetical protein